MHDMVVTLPFSRVIRTAKELADREELCPARGHKCIQDRGLPFYDLDSSDCTNCWIQYLLNGN